MNQIHVGSEASGSTMFLNYGWRFFERPVKLTVIVLDWGRKRENPVRTISCTRTGLSDLFSFWAKLRWCARMHDKLKILINISVCIWWVLLIIKLSNILSHWSMISNQSRWFKPDVLDHFCRKCALNSQLCIGTRKCGYLLILGEFLQLGKNSRDCLM